MWIGIRNYVFFCHPVNTGFQLLLPPCQSHHLTLSLNRIRKKVSEVLSKSGALPRWGPSPSGIELPCIIFGLQQTKALFRCSPVTFHWYHGYFRLVSPRGTCICTRKGTVLTCWRVAYIANVRDEREAWCVQLECGLITRCECFRRGVSAYQKPGVVWLQIRSVYSTRTCNQRRRKTASGKLSWKSPTKGG